MKMLLVALQLIATAASSPGQIDQVCQGIRCESLVVQGGFVRLVDATPPPRTLSLGKYVPTDQGLIPKVEAPIKSMESGRRWKVVVSVFLEHSEPNEGTVGLRLRFFDKSGVVKGSSDISGVLEAADLGSPFGGDDQILAVTSNEEHAYNAQTEIWLLPARGLPKRLISFAGVYEKFTRAAAGQVGGVQVARETYDGEHAETKGKVHDFLEWDANSKSLRPRPAKP
jgi:hypothetical protein